MAHIIINRENLARAIERCKFNHPRVKPAGTMAYAVQRSAGGTATVYFFRDANGNKCAACDCPAGNRPTALVCYHIAAALALHCALVRLRAETFSHPATPAPSASHEAARDADAFCDETRAPEDTARSIAAIERQMRPACELRRANQQEALNELRAVTRAIGQIENTSEIEIDDICAWQRQLSHAASRLEAR